MRMLLRVFKNIKIKKCFQSGYLSLTFSISQMIEIICFRDASRTAQVSNSYNGDIAFFSTSSHPRIDVLNNVLEGTT